jgi:hypothetical protein
MLKPREIYDLLIDSSKTQIPVEEILIGLTWTMCKAEGIGLCMSPGTPTRTLSWSGTLANKAIAFMCDRLSTFTIIVTRREFLHLLKNRFRLSSDRKRDNHSRKNL